MKTHCDLIGLAAKCRNPVVRNALIAAAITGETRTAKRLASAEARHVSEEWNEASAAHERVSDEIERRGLVGERNAIRAALVEYLEIADADKRLFALERAQNTLRALRRAREAQTDKGGAARP